LFVLNITRCCALRQRNKATMVVFLIGQVLVVVVVNFNILFTKYFRVYNDFNDHQIMCWFKNWFKFIIHQNVVV
jgi:hypothetical protein